VFNAPAHVKVYPGASKPLILPAKHDPEIHGEDGLGGVEGLPSADEPAVMNRFVQKQDEPGELVGSLEGMVGEIRRVWKGGKGDKVTVISSGPLTNIALFISVYSNMIEQGAIEEFVFLGGGVGLGNRSAVAEYNILTDRASIKSFSACPLKSLSSARSTDYTQFACQDYDDPDQCLSYSNRHI